MHFMISRRPYTMSSQGRNRSLGAFLFTFMLLLFTDLSGQVPREAGFRFRTEPAVSQGTGMQDIAPCLQRFVDDGSVLGLVTLVDRNGAPLQVDAVGQYQPDTIFQVMSLSKPFVSVAILMLIEEGRIPSVDARVTDLEELSDFPYPEVTFRQLLTHTAGLWPVKGPFPAEEVSMEWHGIAPHLTNRADQGPPITFRDKPLWYVARHYSNPDLYPRDSRDLSQYSNVGFLTLGWIISRLSGEPFEQFMETRIFDPLGMSDSFFFPMRETKSKRSRIATLDRRRLDPPDYDHYEETRPGWAYVSPAGGLYSTAHDLHLFLTLFRHGGQVPGKPRILTSDSIDLLIQDQLSPEQIPGDHGRTLGFYVVRTGESEEEPSTPGTIFHGGRFGTWFAYNPERDEISIFLDQRVEYRGEVPFHRNAFLNLLARIED